MVLSVDRKPRRSEKLLRAVMIVCSVLFLLFGILFSTGFMLPCFLMAGAYYVYSAASRREWEYTLEDGRLVIERVSDRGRTVLHEIDMADIEIVSDPSDPAVARFRRGGAEKVPKFDYTSYRENVPYYTVIARENGQRIKLLLDLTAEALSLIRLEMRKGRARRPDPDSENGGFLV